MVVGVIAIIVVAALAVYLISMGNKAAQQDKLQPLGIDSFKYTQNSEGVAVPMLWGVRKISTTLMWYGNLTSIEQREKQGGKGGGGKHVTTGYEYLMDQWHGICLGPNITIEDVYIDDESVGLDGLQTYFLNDGNDAYFPTEPGQFANRMPGVAHLFLEQFSLGINATNFKNLNLIVKRLSSAPLTGANLSKGVNPAAIIYDVLTEVGVPTVDIDLASFQTAATYWSTQGYGLNIILQQQAKLEDIIARLATYVDFALYQDTFGLWTLKPFTATDSAASTLTTDDYKSFRFSRRSWDDTFNDFRANYIDETQDYTQRTLTLDNLGSISQIGHKIQKSIDLTAFRDVTTASKRLFQLAKVFAYPEAQIICEVAYKHVTMNVGDIVNISHTSYGLVSAPYRLLSIDENHESNFVALTLIQYTENLFDDEFEEMGTSDWVNPDLDANVLLQQHLFELPYVSSLGTTPRFAVLAARQGDETGYTVYNSVDGVSDFTNVSDLTSFSMHGTLDVEYTSDTYSLDDEIGILFTPTRFDPSFASISRAQLMSDANGVVAIMGSEIVGWQTITPEGPSSYRLTGVIRGVLNSPISTHAISSEIWLTDLGASAGILGGGAATQHFKFVPFFGERVAPIASAVVESITLQNKAVTPAPVSRIKAVRSGSTITVTVLPTGGNRTGGIGAGYLDPTIHTDAFPADFYGNVEHFTNLATTPILEAANDETFVYTQAGIHTLSVRLNFNNFISTTKTLSVPAADGTYIGPSN